MNNDLNDEAAQDTISINYAGIASAMIHAVSNNSQHYGEPVGNPLVMSSTFFLDALKGDESYFYVRNSSKSIETLEKALSVLERGTQTIATASGMAAITLVMRALLSQGDTVIVPSDGYYWTRDYAQQNLTRWGVTVIEFPTISFIDDLAQYFATSKLARSDSTILVIVESPSNPLLNLVDIAQLSQLCHTYHARVVVDNTTCTPLGQQPLCYGADIVVASGTKFLAGHSDLAFGYISCNDQELAAKIRTERTASGTILGQFDAWLATRSLMSFPQRFHHQCANARHIAHYLFSHPMVEYMYYPGHPSHPQYKLACEQMQYPGAIISMVVKNSQICQALLTQGTLITYATSFGGYHTTVDRRARWGDNVTENFLRLSIGLEDADDIIRELANLLA